jgi:hypothetical protein
MNVEADDNSNTCDLLNSQANPSTTTLNGAVSPSSHTYLRSTSHILTTPPNPLASNDHPDNRLSPRQMFSSTTFSPIPSAGFKVSSTNVNGQHCDRDITNTTSFFTFDDQLVDNKRSLSINASCQSTTSNMNIHDSTSSSTCFQCVIV